MMKNWGGHVGVALLWILAQLPDRLSIALGKALGRLSQKFLKKRAFIAKRNIERCFPELSLQEQEILFKKNAEYLGVGIISGAIAWFGRSKRVARYIGNVQGLHHLEGAFAKGKGVILLSAHFYTAELAGRLMSLLTSELLSCLHRRQTDPVFEALIQKKRRQYFDSVIMRANVKEMLRSLKNNQGIFYMPDQNFEEEHSMFLPFFGISTLSLTATSRFAQISGCVVLPIFAYFRENTFVMDIEIHPPLTPFPSGDVMKDTLAINQLLEAEIKKHPEQYLWIHRRFKATVENGKGFYE